MPYLPRSSLSRSCPTSVSKTSSCCAASAVTGAMLWPIAWCSGAPCSLPPSLNCLSSGICNRSLWTRHGATPRNHLAPCQSLGKRSCNHLASTLSCSKGNLVGIEAEGISNGQESVRLHARNDIFIEGGNNLFIEMFTAQPPVTHAFVASTILIELHKGNGIRVADIIEALRHSFDYSYARHRNILSIVVPDVIFSSTDEEKQGLIVRPYRSLRAFYTQVGVGGTKALIPACTAEGRIGCA